MMFLLWIALCVWQILSTYALDCYRCSNVSSTDQCHTTVLCQENELCFARASGNGNNTTYDLGCQSRFQCPQSVTTVSPVHIVGRFIQQTTCNMCCENNACNKQLCEGNYDGQCTDDPKFDCATINSAFDVCKDIVHANSICRKYCGLCDFADGAWTHWNNWGGCDVTCGTGQMTRSRTCTNPAPGHGGRDCVGDSTEYMSCSLKKCPVHGQWSRWSSWGGCSKSCGVGVQHRYHVCNNPFPTSDGLPCLGDMSDERICLEKACTDGGWSEWIQWGSCSATCGTGTRTRSRSCDNPTPSFLGIYCNGKGHEAELCNATDCEGLSDCYDIKMLDIGATSGIYLVWPGSNHIKVYCDMDTDGGGWTVFQRRFNGSVDFYRNFSDYEHGFGDLRGEFWLGLTYIKEMTRQTLTELRLDLEAADGSTAYETFQNFSLSGDQYTLNIGQSAGTAGDTSYGLTYHNGQPFSTYDRDNSNNCAVQDHGGWWYHSCAHVNLNGNYAIPGTTSHNRGGEDGVIYYSFKLHQSLTTCQMMFRRS